MYCKNCGQELSADAKFCTGCGKTVGKIESEVKPAVSERAEENRTSFETIEEHKSENAEIKNDETQERPDCASKEQEQAVRSAEAEHTASEKILLTTTAGYGFRTGTLNLYNDRLEFVCSQGTFTYPINKIRKVRKSFGCLEVTTLDGKTPSFGYDGDIVDQWVAKIIRMIPEDNLNMSSVNDGTHAATNNADVSQQISSIKQVGGEKIKEVVGNYKNLQKLPKLKRFLYITIPIIIATIIVFIGIVKFDEAPSDGFYITAAKQVVSENLRSPSTAQFSDVEIADKDEYGRAVITMTVDAQNGFGAYIRNKYAVIIYDVNTSENTFRYIYPQSYSSDSFEKSVVSNLKKNANWGEPLDSD